MGNMVLRSGGFKGTKALVNDSGRVLTSSSTKSQFMDISDKNSQAFEFHPPRMALTSANGDTPIIWMKNSSTTNHFHINIIRVYYNGGNTNHNRAVIVRTFLKMTEPDANITSGQFGASDTPHNLNMASTIEPEINFKFWDGVSTGMWSGGAKITSANGRGDQINCGYFSQGYTPWNFEGALILAPSTILGFSMEVEEDGYIILVPNGWFETPDHVGIGG